MSLFDELVSVMKKLHAPGGCPWDREQTHESLKPYLIEEAYEVIEAIDSGSDNHLREELGDLLLQVVFHAEIAEKEKRFTIEDIIGGIIGKLKRRHPHVFGETHVENSGQVIKNWEEIKRREKREKKTGGSVLDGLPKSLPALIKARRIQEKVSRVGFDWARTEEVMLKVEEELGELKEASAKNDRAAIEEELGDLLFAIANLARFISLCPEDALKKTIDKFQRRFQYIEQELLKRGKKLGEATLEEMDRLWEEVKRQENNQYTEGVELLTYTEQLKEEHKGIKLMLRILGALGEKLKNGEKVNAEHLVSIVEFLRVFADRCHHAKEEDLLFPAMEAAGIPRECGPIGVMLAEHTQGRAFVKGFADAVEAYTKGDEKAAAAIIENAANYVELLSQHIDKEDNVLYPMADMHIPKDRQESLVTDFDRIERERIGEGKHEEFHALLHSLRDLYLK